MDTGDTAQKAVHRDLILATVDNNQYLLHGYWWYCSIHNTSIFNIGYTGAYSVFRKQIQVILLNIIYFDIK